MSAIRRARRIALNPLDARRREEIAAQRLRVLKATMRTVQDIVNNALNSFQLLRHIGRPERAERAGRIIVRVFAAFRCGALARSEIPPWS